MAIKEFFPKDFCDRDETTGHVTLGTKNTAELVNRLKSKFLKEARNIAKFDHPNIIRIYAAFEENNTAYYVMEYIEGESLLSIVKKNGPLPEKRALGYIEKVGEALEYVHARKINHLDIKPANIMVRMSDDTPILIDFGLSKQYDSEGNQTSTMPPGFSHGFAPIEQYNEGGLKGFSPQTDLYSLAATLYYILSGVVPPQATRLVDDNLAFPALIPTHLVGTISKAMATRRRNRYETVDNFLSNIQKEEDSDTIIKPVMQHSSTNTNYAMLLQENDHVSNLKENQNLLGTNTTLTKIIIDSLIRLKWPIIILIINYIIYACFENYRIYQYYSDFFGVDIDIVYGIILVVSVIGLFTTLYKKSRLNIAECIVFMGIAFFVGPFCRKGLLNNPQSDFGCTILAMTATAITGMVFLLLLICKSYIEARKQGYRS